MGNKVPDSNGSSGEFPMNFVARSFANTGSCIGERFRKLAKSQIQYARTGPDGQLLRNSSSTPHHEFSRQKNCCISDEALYSRIVASGDRAAFTELARRYQSFAYRVAFCCCALESVAEEVAVEAFVQILRRSIDFRSQVPGSFRIRFYRLVRQLARRRKSGYTL